nr:MAG TPA: hypothetical protein [Caudoviricetes sp.]
MRYLTSSRGHTLWWWWAVCKHKRKAVDICQ